MHELGVVIEIVRTVEDFAKRNGVTKIDALVLQIGELSSMIPHYIEACYPAAVEGTILADAKLKIETIPGNGRCSECGKVFNLLAQRDGSRGACCPHCGSGQWELLSGKEFLIKEIIAC